MKSRGHSRSALGRSGSWEPADEYASRRQRPSRRQQSAPIPLWPAGGGSPPPRRRRLSPPPLRGGGGAWQPRLALAQVQQPVREKLSARPSSVSSLRRLLVLNAAATASGAAKLCKSSLRDPGHLSPVLLARKVLGRCSRSPDFPGGLPPRSALSAAPGQRGSPPGGGWRRGSPDAPQNTSPGATGASSGQLVKKQKRK